MNPETINTSYEAIQNPILRLMLYMLSATVAALVSGIIYLYRENRALQQQMLDQNRENIEALNNASEAIEALQRSSK